MRLMRRNGEDCLAFTLEELSSSVIHVQSFSS
jgi:hypothetical protein